MIDYISVFVEDFNQAQSFYAAVFTTLGYRRYAHYQDVISFGRETIAFVAMKTPPSRAPQENKPCIHIAFKAVKREQVDKFYQTALAHHGINRQAPATHTYPQGEVYSASICDPFGHELEAVYKLG